MKREKSKSETPQKLTERLVELCNNYGINKLTYIPKRTYEDCKKGGCFSNVEKYVER